MNDQFPLLLLADWTYGRERAREKRSLLRTNMVDNPLLANKV